MNSRKLIRVFFSSPGDVEEERQRAGVVIERLRTWLQGRAQLQLVRWEDEPLRATATFQDEIVERIPLEEIEIAVFVLWSRLGSPLDDKYSDLGRQRTGTEWEFETVLRNFEEYGNPDILVYRRTGEPPAPKLSDSEEVRSRAVANYRDVLDFFECWFRDPKTGRPTRSYHTYGNPTGFEARFERHLRELVEERLSREEGTRATWTGEPFRGLSAFDVEHQPIFFGRARATADAIHKLQIQVAHGCGFLLVIGASGAGKSSLARAGLVAHLNQPSKVEPEAADGFVRRAVVLPGSGSDPFDALASALLHPEALGEPHDGRVELENYADAFRNSPLTLTMFVRERIARVAANQAHEFDGQNPCVRLVLLVDQLEELFTQDQSTAEIRSTFGRAIQSLAHTGLVWIIATIRADFYGYLVDVPEFASLLSEGDPRFDLFSPTPTEIADMVRLPAIAAGLSYEREPDTDRGVDEALIEEATASPGALPLLQFALENMYSHRDGFRLTWAAYNEMGGINGALAERAEQAYQTLSEEHRKALPLLVRALVDVNEARVGTGNRKRSLLLPLQSDPGCRAMIERFVSARLFSVDKDTAGSPVVSVIHEALIQGWQRFADELEKQRDIMRIRERMVGRAVQWVEAGKDETLLLPDGLPIHDAVRLNRETFLDLDDMTRDFLRRSLVGHQQRQQKIRQFKQFRKLGIIAAMLMLLSIFPITWGIQRWSRETEIRQQLAIADRLMQDGNVDDARDVVAALLIRYPDSAAAILKKADVEALQIQQARVAAESEIQQYLEEAATFAEELAQTRYVRQKLRQELVQRLFLSRTQWVPDSERAAVAEDEQRLAETEFLIEQLSEQVRSAIERAARLEMSWGHLSLSSKQAYADFFMERWRDAVERKDDIHVDFWRKRVEAYDENRYAAEFSASGTLRWQLEPNTAEVSLFRLEPSDRLNAVQHDSTGAADSKFGFGIPRLLPIPFDGKETVPLSRITSKSDWTSGMPCLVVTRTNDSHEKSQTCPLVVGDLILSVDGQPAGWGLWCSEVDVGGLAWQAGVRQGDQVVAVDGERSVGLYEWRYPVPFDEEEPDPVVSVSILTAANGLIELKVPRHKIEQLREHGVPSTANDGTLPDIRCWLGNQLGVSVVEARQVFGVDFKSKTSVRLTCFSQGRWIECVCDLADLRGYQLDTTAYPLFCSSLNRFSANAELQIPPGSYLLVARAPGYSELRYPVYVERNQDVSPSLQMLLSEEIPDGFVYIPPCEFIIGGDSDASDSFELRKGNATERGFFMGRFELTLGDWQEFLNSNEGQIIVEQQRGKKLVPRENDGQWKEFVSRQESGKFDFSHVSNVALFGVTADDILLYLEWRNQRQDEITERFVLSLPTEEQWELAARGADGRWYPWGNRFDFGLCLGRYHKNPVWNKEIYMVPVGMCMYDQSVFGVRDLGGNRWEWVQNQKNPHSDKLVLRGGSATDSSPFEFRSASRSEYPLDTIYSASGARLVATPRESPTQSSASE